jgi:hypothetical protein
MAENVLKSTKRLTHLIVGKIVPEVMANPANEKKKITVQEVKWGSGCHVTQYGGQYGISLG